jgi:hypothetical protein
MKTIEKKVFNFKIKEIYFADYPLDEDECDFLKYPFCKNKADDKGFNYKIKYSLIIDLNQSLDTIWQNMGKHCRKYTNRAMKDDLRIEKNKHFNDFYKLNKSLVKSMSRDIRARIEIPKIDTMKRHTTLFTIEHNNNFLVGHLYLEDKDQIFLWFSASKRYKLKEESELLGRAGRLLHWEAIKYAKEKGLSVFDFGGIWSEEEAELERSKKGINFFKMQFGGEKVTRYTCHKFYSKSFRYLYDLYNNYFSKLI